MKKTDEMDRSIQLRAAERGYRAAMLALAAWTLWNCFQTLARGADYHPLPGLILCFASGVQGFSQLSLKQRMVSGDEEYRAPNRLLRTVAAVVAVTVMALSLGTLFLMRSRLP